MKTVIKMARETGARTQQNKNCDVEYLMYAEELERFAEIVREQEREKCAEVCEDLHPGLSTSRAAEYIRARSKK